MNKIFSDFSSNRLFYDGLLRCIMVEILLPGEETIISPDLLLQKYNGMKGRRGGVDIVPLSYMLSVEQINYINKNVRTGRKVHFDNIASLCAFVQETFGLNDCDTSIAASGINWNYPYYRHNIIHK